MLGCSPGIEPYRSNIYTVVQGSLMFEFKNPRVDELFKFHPNEYEALWQSVREHGGSVQHLGFLSKEAKKLYRTADEIDQRELVRAARLRQQWVCQAQSVNLFFRADADPRYVNETHFLAWRSDADGVPLKSLYYLRPTVVSKVEHNTTAASREDFLVQPGAACSIENKDDCLACQG
jgi:ribonucleoside-diphosphate reductase alpha chain